MVSDVILLSGLSGLPFDSPFQSLVYLPSSLALLDLIAIFLLTVNV